MTSEELQRLMTPSVCAYLRQLALHAEEKVSYGNTMRSRWVPSAIKQRLIAAGRAQEIKAIADSDYDATVRVAHHERRDFLRALLTLLPES